MKRSELHYTAKSLLLFSCLFLNSIAPVFSQKLKKAEEDKITIDSLQNVILSLAATNQKLDSLYEQERLNSASLQDKVLKLETYRQKLEGNVSSFKGENLKLNQSNRILIVFNSLVAILLLVTLVFFLRRMGQKKTVTSDSQMVTVLDKVEGPVRFVNFEDKLQQLERLAKLREKGLLSEEEFNSEKHMVLGK
jgi:hypothetical protein